MDEVDEMSPRRPMQSASGRAEGGRAASVRMTRISLSQSKRFHKLDGRYGRGSKRHGDEHVPLRSTPAHLYGP